MYMQYGSICYRVMVDRLFTLRNRDFLRFFCSCDLDLDLMTFIMNLARIPWRYTGCANMNLLRQGFRKFSSDRQTHTDRHTDTTEIIYHAADGQ